MPYEWGPPRGHPAGKATLRGAVGDQARAAVAGEVVVHPLGEYQQPIFELHQVHQMYEDPGEPGGEAGDVQLAELGHSSIAADGGEVALVEVVKRRGIFATGQAALDQAGDVAALLHGDRCHAGQRLAALMGETGEVADDEDFRVSGDTEVGLHDDASGVIE